MHISYSGIPLIQHFTKYTMAILVLAETSEIFKTTYYILTSGPLHKYYKIIIIQMEPTAQDETKE